MRLGKYETVDVIGEGGMSTVYRARDVFLDREVAIKLLKTPVGTDNLDVATRFLNEAKITGRLQHHSIATLFDFGTTPENQNYIVMEFVNGGSLARQLGRLTAEQVGTFSVARRWVWIMRTQKVSSIETSSRRTYC